MSTIGDVIEDTAALVRAFDDLLATDTAKQAPQIAADLGAKPQFDDAMGRASGVVRTVATWVGTAWEVATVADAAVAIFGILPEVVRGAGRAIQDAGVQALELDLDLGGLRSVTDHMGGAVDQVAGALQVGVDAADEALAFVNPPTLGVLQVALDRLATDIAALSAPPLPGQPVVTAQPPPRALAAPGGP